MDNREIQWHPPYIAAMHLELEEAGERFMFVPEYILNTGALKIDLFIENVEEHPIRNEIGKLFQKYNIIEYKNPKDTLDIDVFIKAQSYAGLYKAYGEKSDSRKVESITVSLVREAKPVKLFKYFKAHDIRVTNPYHGIYYVLDKVLFATQIIVTKELDKEKHKWLCVLSGKLEEKQLRDFLTDVSHLKGKMEKEYADSILETALKANRKLAEKVRRDEKMSKTLLEIMEPVMEEIIQKCKEESIREGREKGMREGREKGMREGREEGMREGIREGREEGMVYAYYEMNLSTNEIAKKVQLTEKEVLEILDRIKKQER